MRRNETLMSLNFARLAVCLAVGLGLQGCTTFNNVKTPWSKTVQEVKESPKNPVVRLLAIWQPGEGMGVDNLSTRGFVGQVMFFTGDKPVPAQVEGDVRVYVFDDLGTPEEQEKPIHQFDFPGPAWNALLQKSDIGSTYRVFIPYTRKGNHQAHCTLRIKYQPKQGRVMYSEMVNVTLAGPRKTVDERISTEEQHAAKKPAKKKVKVSSEPVAEEDAADDEAAPSQAARPKSQSKKPRAVPLTDAERDRILAEVRQNMTGQENPAPEKSTREKTEVPEGKAAASAAGTPSARRVKPKTHLLADSEGSSEQEDDVNAVPAKHRRHQLADADPEEADEEDITQTVAIPQTKRIRRAGWDTSARTQKTGEKESDDTDEEAEEPSGRRRHLRVHHISMQGD
ncbi:MAG: hypothetical protein U0903_16525 [Planctomycetales bacterium]